MTSTWHMILCYQCVPAAIFSMEMQQHPTVSVCVCVGVCVKNACMFQHHISERAETPGRKAKVRENAR